jgi:hypothetical protein
VIGGDKIMTEKFDLSEAKVEKVIVHKIGNQFRDEGMQLSDAELESHSALDELLLKHFLLPVLRSENEYTLTHESNINLNLVKHYTSLIFEDNENFFNASLAIAKHLYICSSHPNIGGGEFIEILFTGIKYAEQYIQAIGLFRIETKNSYLDVENHNGIIEIIKRDGIAIDSIQKGAVILSIEDTTFIIDSLGKKTKYWLESFIKATPKNTPKKYTQIIGGISAAISKKITNPENILKFSESLANEDSFSINQLKKISSNFLHEEDINSIVDGFGIKHGVDLDVDFSVDKSRLSKYIKVISKKIPLLDGIEIVISNPNIKIMSFEVQKTDFGYKAIVDIKEGK